VLSSVKVFGGVLVWRRVAAAHVATRHTQAQVHPCAADTQAVFTAIRAGRHFFYLIEVCTFHRSLRMSKLQNRKR